MPAELIRPIGEVFEYAGDFIKVMEIPNNSLAPGWCNKCCFKGICSYDPVKAARGSCLSYHDGRQGVYFIKVKPVAQVTKLDLTEY